MTKSAKPKSQCWPGEQQELLLRAALLPGEDALKAWNEWRDAVDFERLDAGSYRLLPLVYKNLRDLGVSDPLMPKLKEFYRQTWSINQSVFRQMAAVLRSLREAGIETLVLKGGALVPLYYRDHGLRPMVDFDILVRVEQVGAAMNLLTSTGWTPKYKSPEALIPYEHSTEFHDAAGRKLDLHWRVFWEGSPEVSDEEFWSGAISTKIHDVQTLALNPADQVLHVCVHGAKWDVCPPFRWVADAVTVMRSVHPELDWERLIRQAKERRLLLPLRDTLRYIEKLFSGSVPAEVLKRVQERGSEGRIERVMYEARLGNNKPLRTTAIFWQWSRTFRFSRRGGLGRRTREVSNYLKCLWGIEHSWQVPLYVVYKGARAVGGVTAHGFRRLVSNLAAPSRAGQSS